MSEFQSLMILLPETIVVVAALVLLLAGAFCGDRVTRHIGLVAMGVFAAAGAVLFCPERLAFLSDGSLPVFAFGAQIVDDSFTRFVKALVLGGGAASILLSWSYFEKEGQARAEYPVLIMFATLGMMLMVSASDFLALYIGVELQSLALYILAAFKRDDVRSSEAGVKYFVLGVLSSGLLLYGISLIYGFTGTTDFVAISFALRETASTHYGVLVGMVFVCAALVFKVSGVPFHVWTPDVYAGAPTPVTAFFSSAPKIAAVALLTRFLLSPMIGLTAEWHQVIVFIAVASMLWGAFAGLVQTNLKRLLAYSSIANVGYLLVGLLIGGNSGVQAILIYSAIYMVNTLGAFAVVLCLRRKDRAVETIEDIAGLSKTNPVVAFGMAVLMFSLAGVPPLAGFFGKYFILMGAAKAGFWALAVVGALASVVTAYYYLRIIKAMYFDDSMVSIDPLPDWGVRAVIGVSAVAVVGFVLMPEPLVESALRAAKVFVG